MPTPVARLTLLIGALLAALILAGVSVGAGISVADPDDSGDEQTNSETEIDDPASNVEESESVLTPPSIPRSLPERIHDVLHRPLSIFGNGRVPGQAVPGFPPTPCRS